MLKKLHLNLYLGTDTVLLGAIARIVVENGWEDQEWIKKWVNNKWESDSGFGQGTRNTLGNGAPLGVSSKPKVLKTTNNGCCRNQNINSLKRLN